MVDKVDVIDELGRTVPMPPRSSREVLIVSPERIAELEAECTELIAGFQDQLDANAVIHGSNIILREVRDGRITELEAEVKRLRGALEVYADEEHWSVFYSTRYDRQLRTWLGSDYKAWMVAQTALEPHP